MEITKKSERDKVIEGRIRNLSYRDQMERKMSFEVYWPIHTYKILVFASFSTHFQADYKCYSHR